MWESRLEQAVRGSRRALDPRGCGRRTSKAGSALGLRRGFRWGGKVEGRVNGLNR